MIKPIYFLGDIHGEFEILKQNIKNFDIKDCYIIQVGDYGIGFDSLENDKQTLGHLNKFLRIRNIDMYVVRGNHDDPKFFNGDYNLSNLKLLKDYTQLNINDINFLFIGGAISIDRRDRKRIDNNRINSIKKCYWENEIFVIDEEKLKSFSNIDVLVCHNAPDFAVPNNNQGFPSIVMNYAKNDESLIQELILERKLITKAFDILSEKNNIKHYIYGHFHRSYNMKIVDTNFRVLDCHEFWELRSL